MCDSSSFDGFALSPGVINRLAAQGTVVYQCRWRYGDAFRAHPFPPHRRLAGKFTTPTGRALGYFPGDHKGCLCSLVPVFCQLGPVTAAIAANPCAPPEQLQRRRVGTEFFTDEQWDAMNPRGFRNARAAREAMEAAMSKTAEGKRLLATLERWIDGDRSLGPIRKAVGDLLAGRSLPPTETSKRGLGLLRALRESPYQAPDSLYRGMYLKGKDVDNLIAKHFGSETVDMNLSSFSADRARASRFANVGRQKWDYVQVVMEWRGPKQALPVRNAAGGSKPWLDQEWIGMGRFRVIEAKQVAGKIRVVVEQVAGV